jgi:hypothetical protein
MTDQSALAPCKGFLFFDKKQTIDEKAAQVQKLQPASKTQNSQSFNLMTL